MEFLRELLAIIEEALPGQKPTSALVKLKAKIKAELPPPKMPEELVKTVNDALQGLEEVEDTISIKVGELDALVEDYNRKVNNWADIANKVSSWRRSVGFGPEELDLDIEPIDVSISSIDPCNDYGALRWSALNGVG